MIKFRMAKINVSQFAILADTAPSDGISYSIGLGFKAATDAKRIACDFDIEFVNEDKPFLKLGVSCEFDIEPGDWDSRAEKGPLTITKDELGFFANQTVGVTRGIMFCKTDGTPFSQFIVPPINLTTLIKEDFMIDPTKE